MNTNNFRKEANIYKHFGVHDSPSYQCQEFGHIEDKMKKYRNKKNFLMNSRDEIIIEMKDAKRGYSSQLENEICDTDNSSVYFNEEMHTLPTQQLVHHDIFIHKIPCLDCETFEEARKREDSAFYEGEIQSFAPVEKKKYIKRTHAYHDNKLDNFFPFNPSFEEGQSPLAEYSTIEYSDQAISSTICDECCHPYADSVAIVRYMEPCEMLFHIHNKNKREELCLKSSSQANKTSKEASILFPSAESFRHMLNPSEQFSSSSSQSSQSGRELIYVPSATPFPPSSSAQVSTYLFSNSASFPPLSTMLNENVSDNGIGCTAAKHSPYYPPPTQYNILAEAESLRCSSAESASSTSNVLFPSVASSHVLPNQSTMRHAVPNPSTLLFADQPD
ncbi:uncharacterized protein MONOS_8276 [Monocercomonoides exilis]|uniref:uncharacterized protein n=1 Tax=Monocercomonoides exilis TaxID=2049356 RepID=UPI00355A735E|nr:hypothetical protein MONOS_8276 [Monocercomonoides exilis]|eukprot:MONOS_8276.1-p1 / transcript=MONOS_8276.1 / gene=MONOS_8276 / organism=Monocercomonoides_exilis_PA203 / gene_product=unspecified product / transcript_product=unspecified product / location=Mono_scaffold00308:19880-21093(-) / protein_length=389 / sequence_SO=supercontig / SO=protein_coding / is_pseudo=false